MEKLKVSSFFSGIGAFEKALTNIGIDFELVNYCEFDKYASKSYSAIHDISESLNLGDITQIDETKLADFDLMTWGFPCTDISVAGKQKGFIDENGKQTRSGLYSEGLRILQYKKPKYSIIENVKALTQKKFRKEFEQILSDLNQAGYNSYWQVLNAKNYGVPQNRERVFIISIRKDIDDNEFVFPTPFDSGIRLKHLLEETVDEKYYIPDEKCAKLISQIKDTDMFKVKEATKQKYAIATVGDSINMEQPNNKTRRGRVGKGVAQTLTCSCNQAVIELNGIDFSYKNPKIREIANCVSARTDRGISNRGQEGTTVLIRQLLCQKCKFSLTNGYKFKQYYLLNKVASVNEKIIESNELNYIGMLDIKGNEQIRRVYHENGLSPTLSTMQGGNRQPKVLTENKPILVGGIGEINFGKQYRQGNRVYSSDNVAMCLMAQPVGNAGGYSYCYLVEYRIRKLIPLECWRLMGFADDDFYKAKNTGISDSQLYKQAGNSIVVNVLGHIFQNLFKARLIEKVEKKELKAKVLEDEFMF